MSYSPETRAKLVAALANTSGLNDLTVADNLGIDPDDIDDIMLDAGYERCSECEWWCETGELVDEESEPCPCESCAPRHLD